MADSREPQASTANDNAQSRDSLSQIETGYCVEANDNVYKIADEERRSQRLAGFVSQLEYVHSWDSGADSYSKLLSLINIAYPVYVHHEELTDDLKNTYDWIIDRENDIPDELYKQLPCHKRNAMNTVFEKGLEKIK